VTSGATIIAFIPTRNPSTVFLPAPRAADARGLFSASEFAEVAAFFTARPELAPTPTIALPALAADLGLASLHVKDETRRFGLNAFKLLGGRFAIDTLIAEGEVRAGDTLVCASEGNHGRAVARAARDAGCRAWVYMARDAADARVQAIADEGAHVERVDGSYDDAVRIMRRDAAAHGWTIVSDTSWDGYERIPRLIMLGYTHMIEEITVPVDAVFVQGGVGGLLCGVASACAFHHAGRRPRVISVEPAQAACLLASAQAGHPIAVEGPLDTHMAGLRNREVSPLAFEAVQPIVDAYMAIDDAWAFDAMRRLATPRRGDAGIDAGASGSAALGGLLALCGEPGLAQARNQLGLDRTARVLAIVSEGVTDPALWRSVVGPT
jgi:diaminopropionate ammonia-lyase